MSFWWGVFLAQHANVSLSNMCKKLYYIACSVSETIQVATNTVLWKHTCGTHEILLLLPTHHTPNSFTYVFIDDKGIYTIQT